MKWQRIACILKPGVQPNMAVQKQVSHMLNDCELGKRYPFNWTPFVHVRPRVTTTIQDEMNEMISTASSLRIPYLHSFWTSDAEPNHTEANSSVTSLTWIYPRGGGFYWLSLFVTDPVEAERVSSWTPYRDMLIAEANRKGLVPGGRPTSKIQSNLKSDRPLPPAT